MDTPLKEVKLRFIEGENEGIEIRLEVPREIIVGRGEDCDIYLGEKKISRRHCRMVTSPDSLVLEDLKSTNGTFVNGKRVKREELADDDTVRIGTSVFKIDFIHTEDQVSESDSESIPSLVSGPPQHRQGDFNSADPESFGNIDIEEKMRQAEEVSISQEEPEQDSQEEEVVAEPSVESSIGESQPTGKRVEEVEEVDEADSVELDIDFSSDAEAAESDAEGAIDELEIDLEEAEPSHESSSARKKGLSGTLTEIALADLLQTFHNSRKTGILKLTADTKGQVYLQNGSIHYACFDNGVNGSKALFRMLAWKNGDFELVTLPDDFQPSPALGEKIDISVENLLIEGFRQLDELDNLKKGLPPKDAKLVLNPAMESPLSRLHPRVLDILQLIIKHGSFGQVLDVSGSSDLDTAKMVFYLIKKSYILVEA